MSAMRTASGFFSPVQNSKFGDHPHSFNIDLPSQWTWFFLRKKQLLLFFQDPSHLVTKWRNRLLSTTADLRLGQDRISIEHLQDIINSDQYTKLDHGLTKSDLNPKDRQNFNSCVKLTSNDLLDLLVDDINTDGTHVYLQLLKMIIIAYIEKSTTISERKYIYPDFIIVLKLMFINIPLCLGLKLSWCVVFVCRLWWAWIKKTTFRNLSIARTTTTNEKINKAKYFITKPAYLSVEINAHNLLYLVLLVKQKKLPKEALNIHIFNSQSCESMFRNTRSLSGTFSTVVNFTINDFLRRSQKLSMLNQIKNDQSNETLLFPVHHKHKKDPDLLSSQNLDDIDDLDIEQIILEAFNSAIDLIQHSKISTLLRKHDIFNIDSLSKYVHSQLNVNPKTFNTTQITDDTTDDFEFDEEENDDDIIADEVEDNPQSSELHDNMIDDDEDEQEHMTSSKTNFSGIKISDEIPTHLKNSYFKIKINENWRYLHKQSACWLLADINSRLSSDRLSRVIESSRKEKH
ncbi:unnamed protein product [Rotaria sp. Silwood1]|nr:unnamed protein product [Rotaria sp. Silwood1]